MWKLAMLLALGGCGEVKPKDIDAATSGSDAPQTPDGPVELTCQSYCTELMNACTGNLAQFSAMTDCVASCRTWTVGTTADQSGNTLGCRANHATLAKADPTTHCIHAGPSGADTCGRPCEGFCTLARGACTGSNQVFATDADCQAACAGFAPTPPYAATVQSGNSLSCRIYHATAASTAPAVHCAHTTANSVTCQ